MLSQPKQGNYFMLPNEIFCMDLSAGEIALYAFLMRMEDRKIDDVFTKLIFSKVFSEV